MEAHARRAVDNPRELRWFLPEAATILAKAAIAVRAIGHRVRFALACHTCSGIAFAGTCGAVGICTAAGHAGARHANQSIGAIQVANTLNADATRAESAIAETTLLALRGNPALMIETEGVVAVICKIGAIQILVAPGNTCPRFTNLVRFASSIVTASSATPLPAILHPRAVIPPISNVGNGNTVAIAIALHAMSAFAIHDWGKLRTDARLAVGAFPAGVDGRGAEHILIDRHLNAAVSLAERVVAVVAIVHAVAVRATAFPAASLIAIGAGFAIGVVQALHADAMIAISQTACVLIAA